MRTDVIGLLRELQFTEYEAKTYLTLLEKSPLTGYAVALHSGVPRSKIYPILSAMVKRGDILISMDKTPSYTPLPPAELIARRRQQSQQLYDEAETSLTRHATAGEKREDIWNISGRDAILDRVREGIAKAERRILLEIWAEEVEELRESLEKAAARKVEVVMVAYGRVDLKQAKIYHHDMSAEITREFEGRWIVLSADDNEVIAGIVSIGDDSRAAWTTHPGLVMPITEVILHDLYIMEIMGSFRAELEEKFGPDLRKLRKKFTIGLNGRKRYLDRKAAT